MNLDPHPLQDDLTWVEPRAATRAAAWADAGGWPGFLRRCLVTAGVVLAAMLALRAVDTAPTAPAWPPFALSALGLALLLGVTHAAGPLLVTRRIRISAHGIQAGRIFTPRQLVVGWRLEAHGTQVVVHRLGAPDLVAALPDPALKVADHLSAWGYPPAI